MCCNVSTHLKNKHNYILLYKYSVPLCHWVISGLSLDHPGHLGHILSWPSGSHPLTECTGSDHVYKLQWNLSIATFAGSSDTLELAFLERLSFYTGGHYDRFP